MKINALIIDDEESGRNVLSKLLVKFCPNVDVVGTATNVNDGYALCLEKKPHLVFLDIQMPTGNGFKLLEKFDGNIPFNIIFVTGFDKYAIGAIKFSALDYLLKPVEVTELTKAVARAMKVISEKISNRAQIINLLNNVDPLAKEKKISVHSNEKVIVINVSDIHYVEADDRYCNLTTIGGEQYVVTKTLKEFEDFFLELPFLVRISKSVAINTNCIKAYTKEEPYEIEMKDGKLFEISRRKRQEVLEVIKQK